MRRFIVITPRSHPRCNNKHLTAPQQHRQKTSGVSGGTFMRIRHRVEASRTFQSTSHVPTYTQSRSPTHSTHPQPTTNIHKHPSHRLDNNGQNPSHLDNIGIHTTTRYSPSICVSISLNLTRMFEARFPNPAVFQCEHDALSNKLLKPGSLIPRCFSANNMSSPTD